MGIGTSLFFIALGAILRFAVHASLSGISVQTIGTILLVIGVIGLLVALLWSSCGPVATAAPRWSKSAVTCRSASLADLFVGKHLESARCSGANRR